jgi:hypothetical protein
LKDGSYDKMMVGGKSEAPCGADRPCPAEKAVEKPCGSGGPCPAEKPCGADKPCPAEKEAPCGKNKPCPAEQGKMVIDPATADMVPAALATSSEKTEKPTLNHFSMDSRVADSIGFIQQFALKQELKTESLIKE